MIKFATHVHKLEILNTENVLEHWDEISEYIEPALDFTNDITINDVYRAVKNGSYHVIGAFDDNGLSGVIVYKLEYVKEHISAFILAIGGILVSHTENIINLKNLLRQNGVTRMQCIARPSAARLWASLGFTTLYTVMESPL